MEDFGTSLEAFELPERSFGLVFHVFPMPSRDPADLKNSMVFIRREAIEVVPFEVPFFQKCLWNDLRNLLEVFGMSLDVLWRSLGGLGMSFGCVSEVFGCSLDVFGRFITVLGGSRRGLLVSIFMLLGDLLIKDDTMQMSYLASPVLVI